jgi:hypothetical protein
LERGVFEAVESIEVNIQVSESIVMGSEKIKNSKSLGKLRQEICLKAIDECLRGPVPLTMEQIINKCQERVNAEESRLNAKTIENKKISERTFHNYIEILETESFSKLNVPLPLEKKLNGPGNDSIFNKNGNLKTKQRPTLTYTYSDKSFSLYERVLGEADRLKIQEIGAYLKNVSSRWQNDMLEEITQGLEILQLDLNTTQPKVQFELPYHLDENQLQTFKLLYQAIEKQQVIEFEYDRHNAPGEEYFAGKSEEVIRKIRYKVVMSPYFLKQSQNRWYLLGKSHEEHLEFEDFLKPISIERLKKIRIKEGFEFMPNPGITLKDYYRNLVGISMERNQEKKSCWFVTSKENLEKIKKLKTKASRSEGELNEKEQEPFKMILGDFDPKDYQEKPLKIELDLSSFDKNNHQLMEFKGEFNPQILKFVEKNPTDVKLLFPFNIEINDFIFKNGRYMVIQVSNNLFEEAFKKFGFDLITGNYPQIELQRKFNNMSLDFAFGENSEKRGIVAIYRERLKVDTELIKLLSRSTINSKITLLSPKNLLRKAISPSDVKDVILEVNKEFAHSVKSKPFHESQKTLEFGQVKELIESKDPKFKWRHEENKDCVYFHLKLIPNREFENQVLSKGDQRKVIYPFDLRNKLKSRVEKMYQLYTDGSHKITLILEVEKNQANSLISHPLHPSQKPLDFSQIKGLLEKENPRSKWSQVENKDCVYFILKSIPTKELFNSLQSMSNQVKVLYPFNFLKK